MTHSQMQIYFILSLTLWLPFCILLFGYLTYRCIKKIHQQSQRTRVSLAQAFCYFLPILMIFILLMVPLFYVIHLSKQERYCVDVVKFNKITTTDHAFLQEECHNFDLTELIERAYPDEK